MSTEQVTPSPEVLNSWKEIARYLDRGLRTVQRWEREAGLPIRRPHLNAGGRSAVFAFRSELDAWLRSCQMERHKGAVAQMRITPIAGNTNGHLRKGQLSVTRKLILDSQRLQRTALHSHSQLNDAIVRLNNTVTKLFAARSAYAAAAPLPETESLFLSNPDLPILDGAD